MPWTPRGDRLGLDEPALELGERLRPGRPESIDLRPSTSIPRKSERAASKPARAWRADPIPRACCNAAIATPSATVSATIAIAIEPNSARCRLTSLVSLYTALGGRAWTGSFASQRRKSAPNAAALA